MVALLQQFDVFRRKKILEKTKSIVIEKGDLIFKEGDMANHLYFIHSGTVRLYKKVDKTKEMIVFTRKEQEAFGEIGVFTSMKHPTHAMAVERCKLSVIQKRHLYALMAEDGAIGLTFTKWLAKELEISQAKARDYLAFGTEGAVASVFIRYSNMYGVVSSEGISITEQIKLIDISKHIGASRETVSRIVSGWKEKGIVSNQQKRYIIKDIDYLHALLGCKTCAVKHCVL